MVAIPLTVALVWLVLAVFTRRETKAMPRFTGVMPRPSEQARVLAVVPARNEAEVIATCLKGLLNQQGVDLRAVVYDDRSQDQTVARAQEVVDASNGRLTLLRGTQEPPPGWCGKPHALIRALDGVGYHLVRGRVGEEAAPHLLLFLDADVVLRPTAVAEMSELMLEKGLGLCSALPHLVARSFWERVAGPSVGALVTARSRPSRVNARQDPAVLANGQFLMVTPEAYGYVGGHEAVKGEVLEDVALATRIKRSGHPIGLVDGQKVMATRMYQSLGELWEGWTKNAFKLVGGTVGKALMYAVLTLVLGWTPFVSGVTSVVALATGNPQWPLWLAGYLVPLSIQMLLRRVGSQQAVYALFAPLGAAVVAGVLAKATFTAVRKGRVTWKGRTYVDGVGTAPVNKPPSR